MKTLFICIFVALFTIPVMAQHNNWTTYTTSNSDIGGNTILALATDSQHNLWVGTNLGLCRLKGRTWTDYAMFNEKLENQYVNCLTVEPNGTLWIGTDDYGVIKFDGSRWTDYASETKRLNMKFVRDIIISPKGTPWIGVTLSGLVDCSQTPWNKFTAANSELLSDFILCLKYDKKGNLWIGTNDGLCCYSPTGQWSSYTTINCDIPADIVPSMEIASNGVKWIGTIKGLCRFDGTSWKVYNTSNSPLPGNQVNSVAIDNAGAIWAATDNGVAVFDGKKDWQVYKPTKGTLPAPAIQRMVIDKKGEKWFGTEFNGLARFSANGIRGRVMDDHDQPVEDMTLTCGDMTTTTDADGYYYFEIPVGTANVIIHPKADMGTPKPESLMVNNITGFKFGQDFVLSSEMEATGTSSERVTIVPYLADGYIVIRMESTTAKVEFMGENGEMIRTIPEYKNGNRITISKMPRRMYNLRITTSKGEKKLRFNLK